MKDRDNFHETLDGAEEIVKILRMEGYDVKINAIESPNIITLRYFGKPVNGDATR